MGKRFLVSIALILVMVAAIVAASTLIFSGQYDALASTQATPSPTMSFGLSVLESTEPSTAPAVQPEGSALEQEPALPAAAEPTAAPAPTPTPDTRRAQQLLNEMSLEDKIYQMMFVTPEVLTGYAKVTQSGQATQYAVTQYPVGGVIYFATNLVTMDQTQEMLSNIQRYSLDASGIGLFLGVDEEGGSVARAGDNLGTTTFDDMRVYGEEGNPSKAYEIGTTLATDLKSIGFNVDFAPVADVLTNEENTVVKDRSFGSDPVLVSSMVSEEVRGFVENGVLCAPKHFPGHGSTGGDTHDGFAASDRSQAELQECDLKPFQAAIAAGAPMIMVGHMTMTAIDSENPASLSSAVVTGLLREQMGYNGIIITDALNMGAISDQYSSGEAAVKAIQAGCDMLLCVANLSNAVSAVADAVEDGTLTEAEIDEHVLRILQAKLSYDLIP